MERVSQAFHIREELRTHLPYSFISSAMGVVAISLFYFLVSLTGVNALFPRVSSILFHFFHPLHVFFSATTTAAMFTRHEESLAKTFGVGVAGAFVPCVLSDILIPYMGGLLLGVPMAFHLDFVEHPFVMFPILFAGILTGHFISGRIEKSTFFSHAFHVFISTAASLAYFFTYGGAVQFQHVFFVVFICMVAVVVPCCLGDIVFPHLFTDRSHRH